MSLVWVGLTSASLRCIKLQKKKEKSSSSVLSVATHGGFCLRKAEFCEHGAGLFFCQSSSAMTKTTARWSSGLLNPPLECMGTPEATVLIQATSSPDMPPRCPRASLGMPPFCCSRVQGGGCRGWGADGEAGAVGDGHPDYASSYGLFTLDTKQYGKQSIAPQRLKPRSPRTPASPLPSIM